MNRSFPINSRVKVNNSIGTVKFFGEIEGHSGEFLGVEWDAIERGKHNGTVNGIQYFVTKYPTSGSMVRPNKINQFETLEEAIEERYIKNEENIVDELLIREVQHFLHATLFEVVGIEKLMKKQNKFEKLVEVSVSNSTVNNAGDLSQLIGLNSLDLSASLVWNWFIISDIISQLQSLQHINLASNRMVLPLPGQISSMQQKFSNLKSINFRNCNLNCWKDITMIGQICVNLEYICLQDNQISAISSCQNHQTFQKLQTLDLQMNKLSNFYQIINLQNLKSLKTLLLMDNNIEKVVLPECEYDQKLEIFPKLESLFLRDNPIKNEMATFNELDKLPKLNQLTFSPSEENGGYEEMFSRAAALISNLKNLNKVAINDNHRRGAEYDIWKMLAAQWLQIANEPLDRLDFNRNYRCYHLLIQKHGTPEDFSSIQTKKRNSITIRLMNGATNEEVKKKMPLRMSLQTLHAIVHKSFTSIKHSTSFDLYYVDAKNKDIRVCMDNLSKSLDYYSIQDNDLVLIEIN